jgi:hypothetical protein
VIHVYRCSADVQGNRCSTGIQGIGVIRVYTGTEVVIGYRGTGLVHWNSCRREVQVYYCATGVIQGYRNSTRVQ